MYCNFSQFFSVSGLSVVDCWERIYLLSRIGRTSARASLQSMAPMQCRSQANCMRWQDSSPCFICCSFLHVPVARHLTLHPQQGAIVGPAQFVTQRVANWKRQIKTAHMAHMVPRYSNWTGHFCQSIKLAVGLERTLCLQAIFSMRCKKRTAQRLLFQRFRAWFFSCCCRKYFAASSAVRFSLART